MTFSSIDIENHLISTNVISRYLLDEAKSIWTVEEACVSGRTVANRTSVPPDAVTKRYLIEHPDQGWSFAVRAVWRCGKLMQPTAVHVVIERYYDDNDTLGGPDGARLAANGWLRALPL